MNHEEWRSVVGWEGLYEVSDRGNVRSLARYIPSAYNSQSFLKAKTLKGWPATSGHLLVELRKDGRRKNRPVHQLVLEAFVGPRPDGLMACHNDSNKENNSVSNLRWDTAKSNVHDMLDKGDHYGQKLTHCKRGHEFIALNMYTTAKGGRGCAICLREQRRRREQGYRNAARQRRESKVV